DDGCSIGDGQSDTFDGGLELFIDGEMYEGTRSGLQFDDREALCDVETMSDIEVSRQVYVPEDQNWARFVETFHNPTGSEVCIDVALYSNMGSDGSDYLFTSSGDLSWDIDDNWLLWDDTSVNSGDSASGFLYQINASN